MDKTTHKTICVKCGTELAFECMRNWCEKCKMWVFYDKGEIKEIERRI